MEKLIYNQKEITYSIIRAKIKNLYIHVKEGKVIVKAPKYLKEKQIKEFVNKKAKWIYEKVNETKAQKKQEEPVTEEELKRLVNVVEKNIKKYSMLLNISPNKVTIKNIKYAWGSCSSKKNISINQKLAKKSEKEIEYVVLHEMSHLIHMNHSKEFWTLVEKYMPDYKIWRKELKK